MYLLSEKAYTAYYSGGKHQRSLGDRLLLSWANRFANMFPPLPLIPKVLQKLQRERLSCSSITPWWLCQPWLSSILHLSWGLSHHFPLQLDLLVMQALHHNVPILKLTVWNIFEWIFLTEFSQLALTVASHPQEGLTHRSGIVSCTSCPPLGSLRLPLTSPLFSTSCFSLWM